MPDADQSPVFIVTGAAGNLGQATVRSLLATGARIVAIDRAYANLPAGSGAAGAGHEVAMAEFDLLDPAQCQKAVAFGMERFGRIDGLAHTVGGFAMAPAADSTPALWRQMLDLNLMTTLNMFQALLAPMRAARRGSLIAIGAGAAIRAASGMSAYAAAKSGVHRLVESFAEELKADRIRVNAILPSIIDTPQNRASMPDADHAAWVSPAEIAEVIAFLLDERASGVTGAFIPVTGRV